MEAAAKKSEQVAGILDTPELANGFISPLDDILKSSVEQAVINFNKEDNSIKINAINESKTAIIFVDYLSELVDAVTINEDYDLGIYELSEFAAMSKIFSDGFSLNIEDHVVTVENEGQEFTFISSDTSAIQTGPKKFSGNVKWVSEFAWTPELFGNFTKAIGRLSQDYVTFEGKEGEKSLSIKVCDKDMRSSAFKTNVDLEDTNQSSFKVILNKEYFQPVVTASIKNLQVQISDKLVSFVGKSEYSKIKYYISAVAS